MTIRTLQFIAIALTALALVPGGAHVLQLPNKIHLDQDRYLVVQSLYRGWALLGVVLIAAVLANLLLAFQSRSQTGPMLWAAAATALLGATLAIFFVWTYPVNNATDNWSVALPNWDSLRRQWEYSHAANAALTFLALCATTASSLNWSDRSP